MVVRALGIVMISTSTSGESMSGGLCQKWNARVPIKGCGFNTRPIWNHRLIGGPVFSKFEENRFVT